MLIDRLTKGGSFYVKLSSRLLNLDYLSRKVDSRVIYTSQLQSCTNCGLTSLIQVVNSAS